MADQHQAVLVSLENIVFEFSLTEQFIKIIYSVVNNAELKLQTQF